MSNTSVVKLTLRKETSWYKYIHNVNINANTEPETDETDETDEEGEGEEKIENDRTNRK